MEVDLWEGPKTSQQIPKIAEASGSWTTGRPVSPVETCGAIGYSAAKQVECHSATKHDSNCCSSSLPILTLLLDFAYPDICSSQSLFIGIAALTRGTVCITVHGPCLLLGKKLFCTFKLAVFVQSNNLLKICLMDLRFLYMPKQR